jgi:wobble nucleotide-excising tRNase
MAKLTLKQRQQKLDIQKWVESKRNGKDMCGEYDFCQFCDKSVQYPCAKAYNKMQKANKKA